MCVLGTFSQYAVLSEWSCIRIEPDIPFRHRRGPGELRRDHRLLLGYPRRGRPAWRHCRDLRHRRRGHQRGAGRAVYAGAKHVIAIDPVEFNSQSAKAFGATHALSDPAKAAELVVELTRGQLADHVICTVGEMNAEVVRQAVDMTGKTGQVTITGVGYYDMTLPGNILIGYQRRLQARCSGARTRSMTSR